MMVSKVARGHLLNAEGKEKAQLRELVSAGGALIDFELTRGFQRLEPAAATAFHWRDSSVRMVCYSSTNGQMLFLFIVRRVAMIDAPPSAPILTTVSGFLTASWTHDDEIYLLVGPNEPNLASYLPVR
jgi:hypothetical protein